MRVVYEIKEIPDKDELESAIFDYGIDDHIWYEDNDTKILTENPRVISDLEQVLSECGIQYEKCVQE